MTRIEKKFAALKDAKKKGLVIYLMAGVPDAQGTIEAVKMAEAGILSPAEIAEALRELADRVDASFVLDRLDYMVKGGRCSAVAALGANLLKLKPSIHVVGGKIVEINTGAIARGWMDDVYPSAAFRALLRARGVRFLLGSDAHAAAGIDCAFERYGDEAGRLDKLPLPNLVSI